MVRRLLPWLVTVLIVALWVGLVAVANGQGVVPRVTCLNPVAGISIQIPEDWEMGTNDWGSLFIGLDAG
ncbi:MAG: hypothetical protein WCP21_02395, partial [Armatimonadota bacterium]